MAQLPDPTNITRRIPGGGRAVVPVDPGQVGTATAQLGQTLAGIGQREEEKQDRLALAKARTEWVKTRSEAEAALEGDKDYATMESRYRKALEDRLEDVGADIRDPELRETFRQRQLQDLEVDSAKVRSRAFAVETDHERSLLDQDIASMRELALKSNTADAIEAMQERINNAAELGYVSEVEATNLRQKATRDYAVTRVELAPFNERKALIEGPFKNYITEDDKRRLLKASSREYTKDLNDYIAYLSSGGEPELTRGSKFSPQQVNEIMGEDAGRINEAIRDAIDFGKAVNQVKTATPTELNALLEREKPKGPAEFRRESKQYSTLVQAINDRNSRLASDPAKYVMQNYTEAGQAAQAYSEAVDSGDALQLENAIADYAAVQRELQEELGLPQKSVQLLTTDMANKLAEQLNDFSQGGEQAALTLTTMKENFGPEWDTVQRQLQSEQKLGSALNVMAGMDFGPEMTALGEANSVGKKAYKDIIDPDVYKDIQLNALGKLDSFQDTLRGQPGGEDAFRQHRHSIEVLAMKYIADGRENSANAALDQAIEDVLGKRFEFVNTYRIPKAYNTSDIESGVDNIQDGIRAGEYDLLLLESGTITNPEDLREVNYSAIRPTPITAFDGSGIMFINQNDNVILNPQGDPLIFNWDEILEKADTGFFSNLGGFVPGTKGAQPQ